MTFRLSAASWSSEWVCIIFIILRVILIVFKASLIFVLFLATHSIGLDGVFLLRAVNNWLRLAKVKVLSMLVQIAVRVPVILIHVLIHFILLAFIVIG